MNVLYSSQPSTWPIVILVDDTRKDSIYICSYTIISMSVYVYDAYMMYICLCVYVYVYTHASIDINVYIHISMYVYKCINIYISI